ASGSIGISVVRLPSLVQPGFCGSPANAESLLLLGFGYLEQNLQLLVPEPLESRGARSVLGTAYGIEQPSHSIVEGILGRLATKFTEPSSLLIEPGTCSDLFHNYNMHLRF
ncbi:hypothetical protein, partial [Novosphingobium indicum]|uniref:hypothetical protein n=1 Tax=Novosphingobium indicum TaxID=462949 RepID=UPI001E49CF0E